MCKIMIVEDDAMIAIDLAELITNAGHEVQGMAFSVAIARKLAEDTRPDLAIMDIRLSERDHGVALAHELHHRWGVRSIVVTGLPIASQIDGNAVVAWLGKPFHSDQVLFLIDKHRVPRNRTPREGTPAEPQQSP
jgi:DNA-binding response OmpR family regulator